MPSVRSLKPEITNSMKWIKSFIRKVCEWNIIMSNTTLVSMDLMDDLKAMNKTFKDKIENPTNEGKQTCR